jgi:hypothetical protein
MVFLRKKTMGSTKATERSSLLLNSEQRRRRLQNGPCAYLSTGCWKKIGDLSVDQAALVSQVELILSIRASLP